MTHKYIGTKIITAWRDDSTGKEGYGVKYEDGYTSWSPKETFEAAYRVIEGDGQALSFGDALVMMKAGKRVTRKAWNPNSFVYHVPAASYPAQTGAAKEHFGVDALIPYKAYLAIKQADETVCVFIPGMDSLLAEDWRVIE